MRTSEATIRAAILHPVHEIRTKALNYFSHRLADDTTRMPLVTQAVEKYGWERAFTILRGGRPSRTNRENGEVAAAELGKEWHLENIADDNYFFAIALILCRSRCS